MADLNGIRLISISVLDKPEEVPHGIERSGALRPLRSVIRKALLLGLLSLAPRLAPLLIFLTLWHQGAKRVLLLDTL